jgi:2-polyprenyl-6-hydroxyphenyl methylase/3-demethylubiquinone-9 3-methyltransferase
MSQTDRTIYDTFGPRWWAGTSRWLRTLHNLVPARFEYFDTLISQWGGKVVLDIGCGGGFMAEALARRGAVVIGVDPSREAIEAAREHAGAQGLAIDYRTGVGERLPIEAGSVDVVVCVDVLEHVDDLNVVISEVRRVLRPGGLFLFDTINATAMARLCVVFVGERILRLLPRGTHDPDKFIRPGEMRAKLIAAGFACRPFVGLGPRGINRRFDLTFGKYPTLSVLYLGCAALP